MAMVRAFHITDRTRLEPTSHLCLHSASPREGLRVVEGHPATYSTRPPCGGTWLGKYTARSPAGPVDLDTELLL